MVGNRRLDIITCTSEVIPHGILRHQWSTRIFIQSPCKMQRPKTNPFQRIRSELMPCEVSESENEPPQFSHYEPNVLRMMENMRYDLTNGPGLNLAKEGEHYFDPSFQKGKPLIIIIELAGVGLCVNSNLVGFWVWKVIISLPLVRHAIAVIRCQCRQHLQRNLSKHSFNKPPGRWKWRNDPVRYRSLD